MEEQVSAFLKAWQAFWHSSISESIITKFRITHGVAFLFFLIWNAFTAESSLTDAGYHLSNTPVPLLPDWAQPYFTTTQFIAAILFLLGIAIRAAATVCWLTLLYMTLADRLTSSAMNSIYLFTFLIFSVFRTQGSMVVAPVRLLQIFVLSIYVGAGWSKAVHGDWLTDKDTLITILQGHYMTECASWLIRSLPSIFITAIQHFTVAFELFSPVLFLTRSLVPIGVTLGGLLHTGISFCMADLGIFSLLMVSFYLLFIPQPSDNAYSGGLR